MALQSNHISSSLWVEKGKLHRFSWMKRWCFHLSSLWVVFIYLPDFSWWRKAAWCIRLPLMCVDHVYPVDSARSELSLWALLAPVTLQTVSSSHRLCYRPIAVIFWLRGHRSHWQCGFLSMTFLRIEMESTFKGLWWFSKAWSWREMVWFSFAQVLHACRFLFAKGWINCVRMDILENLEIMSTRCLLCRVCDSINKTDAN